MAPVLYVQQLACHTRGSNTSCFVLWAHEVRPYSKQHNKIKVRYYGNYRVRDDPPASTHCTSCSCTDSTLQCPSPPSVQVGMTMSAYLSPFLIRGGQRKRQSSTNQRGYIVYYIISKANHGTIRLHIQIKVKNICLFNVRAHVKYTETRVVSYTLYIKKYYTTRYILVFLKG